MIAELSNALLAKDFPKVIDLVITLGLDSSEIQEIMSTCLLNWSFREEDSKNQFITLLGLTQRVDSPALAFGVCTCPRITPPLYRRFVSRYIGDMDYMGAPIPFATLPL